MGQNGQHLPSLQDFQKKWESMSKGEWLRTYNQAFQRHVKITGLKPLVWGDGIKLPPTQMEALRVAKNTSSVLDFGCGRGFLTVALKESGVNVIGVDPSSAAIHFAKSNYGGMHQDVFSCMDEDQLSNADSSFRFQCVVATEILEFVQSPKRTLGILWNRINDGGFLVASFPRKMSDRRIRVFSRQDVQDLCHIFEAENDYPIQIQEMDDCYLLVAEKDPISIRYCQVLSATNTVENINEWESEKRFKTGVTNWLRIFHGRCLRPEDLDVDDFDVIHIQLAGDSIEFPMMIREMIDQKGSNAKLVVNIDYPLERWHHSFGTTSPDMLIRQMNMADEVFSQTYRGAEFLSDILGKNCPYVPHPVEIDKLKQWAIPVSQRSKGNVVINTHYDNQHYFPAYITKEWGVQTHLVGFIDPSGIGTRDSSHRLYTYVYERQGCQVLVQDVYRNAYISFDHYSHNVQGRTTIEFAGLGVPCLGWDCVDSQVLCFPDLTAPVGDVVAHKKMFRRLMEDADFYEEVCIKAQDAAEFYNYANSKQRFLNMVKHGKDESSQIPSIVLSANDDLQSGRAQNILAATA